MKVEGSRKADFQDLVALKIIEDRVFRKPRQRRRTQRAAETVPLKASLLRSRGADWWGSVNGAVIDEPIIRDAPTTMMLACA